MRTYPEESLWYFPFRTTRLSCSNHYLFEDSSNGVFVYAIVQGQKLTLQYIDDTGVVDFEQTITHL